MLRKKFGGPRVSAAKQVVALKPTSAAVAVTEEPTTTTVATSAFTKDSTATSTVNINGSTQKNSDNTVSDTPATASTKNHNESVNKTPAINNSDETVDDILPANIDDDEVEDEPFIAPATPLPAAAARTRTFSQTSMFSTASSATANAIKRKKRTFEKDEELDAGRFTMADLIDWKPKTENTLRSKWKEAEKKFKEEGFAVKREKKEEEVETEIGPKVKIDEQGNVIIDEDSLVVRRNPENSVFETVDDDLMPKKLNSLSFKKNYSRATNWSEIETELFYEVLSSTGTDFSLMQEYLPFKTRADLKKKFNKEEKVNLVRINNTLSKPSILNDAVIRARVGKYVEIIDRQKEEKLAAKLGKKKKPIEKQGNSDAEVIEEPSSEQKSEAVDSEHPLPVAETTAQKEKKARTPKPKAEKVAKPKKATKKKAKKEPVAASTSEESYAGAAPSGPVTPPTVLTRSATRKENESNVAALSIRPRNTTFGGLFGQLGEDFPYFDIEEDESIEVPSLKKMPGDLVILRVPTATQLKVMPKTKKSVNHRIGIITPNNTKYFVGVSASNETPKSLMLHKL